MSIYQPGRPKKYCPSTKSGHIPPCQPGEYRIRNTDKSIIYIGETNNLKRRMQEHIRTGKLQDNYTLEFQCADKRSSSRTRRIHERAKIAQHKPLLNQSHGGEGRFAKKR